MNGAGGVRGAAPGKSAYEQFFSDDAAAAGGATVVTGAHYTLP